MHVMSRSRELVSEILETSESVCLGSSKSKSDMLLLTPQPCFIVFMNWIDNHSRVDEGAIVVSCRINRLFC